MKSTKTLITKSKIQQLDTGDKIWDIEVVGFYVYKQKTKTSFYYKYRIEKKQKLANLGQCGSISLDDARTKAKQYYVLSKDGIDPELYLKQKARELEVKAVKESYTISDAYSDWEEHFKPQLKQSSLSEWTLYNKYVKPEFGDIALTNILPEDVNRFHRSIAKPYSANRSIKILKKLYSVAETLGRYEGKQPFIAVKLHSERKRRRHLTGDEPRRLFKALEMYRIKGAEQYKASACVMLYLLTSARKSEWLSARKEWVDLKTGVLMLPDSKNGEADEKMLPRAAIEILIDLFEKYPDSPWVFPSPKKKGQPLRNIKRHWNTIRIMAGLKDFRLHDLRRSFASFALTSGYDLHQIGDILNHRNVNTTKGYAYLINTAKRTATENVANVILHTMRRQSLTEMFTGIV